jgi:Cu(I)/Ag(I) efflux system membrane fusion protein
MKQLLLGIWKKAASRNMVIAAAILVSFIVGMRIGRPAQSPPAVQSHAPEQAVQWTCSMHPQIILPRPGKCPICFMDLIPLKTDAGGGTGGGSGRRLTLSESARALAGIATVPAVRRSVYSDIRLSGKIAVDETRLETVSARVSGRLDRLYVNTPGITVKKGDHLALIYSPELISAQQELLGAAAGVASLGPSASEMVRANAAATLSAAREKLRLLGFADVDIEAIGKRGTIDDHMTIRSGQSGVVL